MAQRTEVTLICDLCEDGRAGTETIRFGLDGATYEIDVCDRHGKRLRDALASYLAAGRRSRTGGGRRRGSTGPGNRERMAEIRAWAKKRGIKVSERGRVAADVVAKYEASRKS